MRNNVLRKKCVDRGYWMFKTKQGKKVYMVMRDNDHPNPHIHVTIGSVTDSFDILTGRSIHHLITGGESKEIKKWIMANQKMLKHTWNQMYPIWAVRDADMCLQCKLNGMRLRRLKLLLRKYKRYIKLLQGAQRYAGTSFGGRRV